MACTANLVCFDCRFTANCPTWRHVTHLRPWLIGMESSVVCSQCQHPMRFLGPSIEVPPKRKEKEWKSLFKEIEEFRRKIDLEIQIDFVNQKHELEKEIEKLRYRPENKERLQLIKVLEERIKKNRKHISKE